MMTLADQMADDVGDVFLNLDENAVEAIYKQGAAGKLVRGIWCDQGESEDGQDDGPVVVRRGVLYVDGTANGITAPALTDRVVPTGVPGGDEWEVESIGDRGAGMVRLSLVRIPSRKVGRDARRSRS